jgi:DNA-directed RNA polymerase specialized sigma24 family protein
MAELLRPEPLSRVAFEAAIRQALPHLSRADRLAASPLLGTALVAAGTPDPVAGLQAVMRSTVAALGQESRGQEHRRVLERTYLRGVPSQEAAAELLQLPFSTYRRHLAKATERLIEVLWSIEIGERPAAPGRPGTEPEMGSE